MFPIVCRCPLRTFAWADRVALFDDWIRMNLSAAPARISRTMNRVLAILMIAALFVAATASAALTARSADAYRAQSRPAAIVGSWTATVVRDDGTVEKNAGVTFTADGRVTTTGAVGTGTGTWTSTGSGCVVYTSRTAMDFGYLVITADVRV